MINKYSSEIESPYLLDLLDPEYKLDTKETRRRCSNINKSWDKQLKKIAKALELPPISPMWARHQRSTKLIDDGATKEEINTILGHDSMKTTETYIHSFPSAQKIKLKAEKLDNELM
jgi:integrase